MQSIMARKMWRTLEPYHGMIYFSPQATEEYAALGVTGRAGYFASRSAAMGAVSAEVVTATFFNFCPSLVASAIPAVWDTASPAELLSARLRGVDRSLRTLLGDAISSAEMRSAAEVARQAALACPLDGRPLYAGHAGLAWPSSDQPHLVLWHALTLLREYRGDGHIAALVMADLTGIEALISHAAKADGLLPPDILQQTRGWPDDDWQAARSRLQARGWLDDAGRLTAEGDAGRERVEQTTDERAMTPWLALGEELCDQLRFQVRPFSKAIVESGGLGRLSG
jgi:hypothetical protein